MNVLAFALATTIPPLALGLVLGRWVERRGRDRRPLATVLPLKVGANRRKPQEIDHAG